VAHAPASLSGAPLAPLARADAAQGCVLPPPRVVALVAALAFVAATSAPLALYTISLAVFGLPHALAELRFIGVRYGPVAPRPARAVALALLSGVVAERLVALITQVHRPRLELALAVALAALALPHLARRSGRRAAAGAALIGGVAVGAAVAPTPTLLALAVLHNLTPVGFLAEATTGHARRQVLIVGGVLFAFLPALLASGAPVALWQSWAPLALEADPLDGGPLATHFGAFFPAVWHGDPAILNAFAAVAFLQVMHHSAVLGALPRLLPARAGRPAVMALGALGSLGLLTFSLDFTFARRIYGVVAAVHAWIELPVLLAALAGPVAATVASATVASATVAPITLKPTR
jgi:hypothetical protein